MWTLLPQRGNPTNFVGNRSMLGHGAESGGRPSISMVRIRLCRRLPQPPMPRSAHRRSGTQSVERAIAVLECFASSDRPLGLTEIARAVGLTPSTAHRLLRALIAARYVEQDPTTEHYRLGLGVAVLGQRALEQSGYNLARPILERLSADTGESTSLGIRRGTEVVVIERTSGSASLRFDHPAGAKSRCTPRPWARCSSHSPTSRSTPRSPGWGTSNRSPKRPSPPRPQWPLNSSRRRSRLRDQSRGAIPRGVRSRRSRPVERGVGARMRSACRARACASPPHRLNELAPFVVAAANDVASLVVLSVNISGR